MQIINISTSSASVFCENLRSVAVPSYFDSVEMVDGSTSDVECKIGDVVAMRFKSFGAILGLDMVSSSGSTEYTVNRSGSQADYYSQIIVTDSAIILRTHSLGLPIVIGKDKNNQIIVCAEASGTTISNFSSAAGSVVILAFSILGGGSKSIQVYVQNDASMRSIYAVPVLTVDSSTIKDVYMSLIRPFPGEREAIQCTINGTGYVTVGYSSLLVKTT